MITGFRSWLNESLAKVRPATLNPIWTRREGLDVNAQVFFSLVGADSVESGTTDIVLNATAHAAQIGDIIVMSSGAANGQKSFVVGTTANTITLGQRLSATPSAGNTFNIYTGTLPLVSSSGAITVTISAGTPLTGNAPGTATAGVASGTMVAANASRKGLIITNNSVNRVFLATGSNAAVLARGIYLGPGGGTWTMGAYDFTQEAINGIAAAAGSVLSYQEFQ